MLGWGWRGGGLREEESDDKSFSEFHHIAFSLLVAYMYKVVQLRIIKLKTCGHNATNHTSHEYIFYFSAAAAAAAACCCLLLLAHLSGSLLSTAAHAKQVIHPHFALLRCQLHRSTPMSLHPCMT